MQSFIECLSSSPSPEALEERQRQDALLRSARGRNVVYFVGGTTGPIKIGTTSDIDARLRTIRAHSPVRLVLLGLRPGGSKLERAYHELFDRYRSHGEWFHRSADLMQEVARWAAPAMISAEASSHVSLYYSLDGDRKLRRKAIELGW